jgi:hypothetical protein
MGKRNQSSCSLATTSFAANPTQTRITQNFSLFTGEIDTKVTHWFFFWLQERTHTPRSLWIFRGFQSWSESMYNFVDQTMWFSSDHAKHQSNVHKDITRGCNSFYNSYLESRYLCHTVYSLQSVTMVCIQIENLRTPIQECWGVPWTWPMSWGTSQGERSSSCTKCVSWNAWSLCNRAYYNTEIAMQVLLVLSM